MTQFSSSAFSQTGWKGRCVGLIVAPLLNNLDDAGQDLF